MNPQDLDVLIVDDDIDIRIMIQSILTFHGYESQVCSNPDQMYITLQSSKPKLILMDMLLSGTDGREVCKKLKNEIKSPIPIMMISAHPDAEKTCIAAGANAFLEKPFEIDIFLEKVGSFIQ